ncbi:MAG: protein kinase [Victivallaceae bacterium]|nr:protein kinase [Victivallaceae bacterium]
MTYRTNDTLDGFRLICECGMGAFGAVFLAEHPYYGRVALKIVYKNGRNCERELKGLRSYMTICKRTDLLQIYHVAENEECFYYAMDAADDLGDGEEYCPATLENKLKKEGRLAPDAILDMYEELKAALGILHSRGVCHRDLKPGNILWIGGRAVPGDIGLVSGDTQTMLAGTPGFMRPEVLAGTRSFSPQDDFYALGKILYCSLTGFSADKYPSFPGDATITGCGEVIRLYNQLCAGEIAEAPRRKKTEKRNFPAPRVALAAAAILFIAAAAYFAVSGYNAHLQSQAQKTAQEKRAAQEKSVVPLTDEEALEKLHRELLAEWEEYREEEKARIASDAKNSETWRKNFPESMRPQMKENDERRRQEMRAGLEAEEKNLPRLREVAQFYLRFFPDILKEDREKEPFGYVCGNSWLEIRLDGNSSGRSLEKEKQSLAEREKTMLERFGETRHRQIERDGIYRAMRSFWRVENILKDPDFEKTLRRYDEIFRELP